MNRIGVLKRLDLLEDEISLFLSKYHFSKRPYSELLSKIQISIASLSNELAEELSVEEWNKLDS